MKMYSVFDKKALSYAAPFVSENNYQARRTVYLVLSDGTSSIVSLYPEDFALYCIGDFDPESSVIVSFSPEFVSEISSILDERLVNYEKK